MPGVKSTRLNSSHTIISYAWSSDVCSSDRKSTRLNSSHTIISYAVFCLEKTDERSSRPDTAHSSFVGVNLQDSAVGLVMFAVLQGGRLLFFFKDGGPPGIHPLPLRDALPF